MLTYQTAGESHGKEIAAFVDGYPSGVEIDSEFIDGELRRRQGGYGRGGRQAIETDRVEIRSGVLRGKTTGSPILLSVKNRDYKIDQAPEIDRPRPGHGDLSGSIKYGTGIRPILERASARETAGRVAAGALASVLLREFGVRAVGYVLSVGPLFLDSDDRSRTEPSISRRAESPSVERFDVGEILARRDRSELYSLFPDRDDEAKTLIDECREAGDTLGGIVEVRVFNVPFGLGTHSQWDRKLDGRLAQAAMAVQAIKGVEIGLGFESALRFGSNVHDPIEFAESERNSRSFGFRRPSNNAGGLEAGTTNGQTIVLRAAMKPIATLKQPLASIDLSTKQPILASYERSDVCAVSAASVVLENVVAFEIAAALVDKFGGDSLAELLDRFELFQQSVARRLA